MSISTPQEAQTFVDAHIEEIARFDSQVVAFGWAVTMSNAAMRAVAAGIFAAALACAGPSLPREVLRKARRGDPRAAEKVMTVFRRLVAAAPEPVGPVLAAPVVLAPPRPPRPAGPVLGLSTGRERTATPPGPRFTRDGLGRGKLIFPGVRGAGI